MKTLLKTLLVTGCLMFAAFTAPAQTLPGAVTNTPQPIVVISQLPGVYPSSVYNGTSNAVIKGNTTTNFLVPVTNTVVANGVTNSYTNLVPSQVWAVSEHPTAGLSMNWYNPGITATNGTNIISLVRSFDNGNTYEGTAFLLLSNVLPTAVQQAALGGADTNTTLFDIYGISNATHIGILSIQNNGGATAWCSNVFLNLNLNSPLTYSTPAPR